LGFELAITVQRVIRHPIDFMFGSMGGVFGDGESKGVISAWIKSKMAAGGHLENL